MLYLVKCPTTDYMVVGKEYVDEFHPHILGKYNYRDEVEAEKKADALNHPAGYTLYRDQYGELKVIECDSYLTHIIKTVPKRHKHFRNRISAEEFLRKYYSKMRKSIIIADERSAVRDAFIPEDDWESDYSGYFQIYSSSYCNNSRRHALKKLYKYMSYQDCDQYVVLIDIYEGEYSICSPREADRALDSYSGYEISASFNNMKDAEMYIHHMSE